MNHRRIILLYIIYAGLRFVRIIRYTSVKHNSFYKYFQYLSIVNSVTFSSKFMQENNTIKLYIKYVN